MKSDLLIHEVTRRQLSSIITAPPHALLLIGPVGSGKETLSKNLAAELVNITPEKFNNHPGLIVVEKPADKSEISIDAIRNLIKSLSLRATTPRRVVIINDAHFLSEEAQNSLLKLIEEPPQLTIFILSAPALSAILPTVSSRAQKVKILPISKSQALKYFDQYPEKDVTSAWLLSRGAPGLITSILDESSDHPLKKAVEDAKRFLAMNRYDRLIFLEKITKETSSFQIFLDALDRVAAALSVSAISRGEAAKSRRVLLSRAKINATMEALSHNTSPKLLALDLALSLPI